MQTLFPIEPNFPNGFTYTKDFITGEEERKLIGIIKNFELKNLNFQGYEAKRKVASFGYDWSFERRVLSKGKEIPNDFEWLIKRVSTYLNAPEKSVSELLLTEYPKDSVINWHRDAPPFDIIVGISLLSDCLFKLRPCEKSQQSRKNVISFPVLRRSLYVISGESRTEWEHSIAPVKEVRYSITLRTVK